MDKKWHKSHMGEEVDSNKFKKQRLHEIEDELDLDFVDELDDDLMLEVKHLLRK